MTGLIDERVEELNQLLARRLPEMRKRLDEIESAVDLAVGHAAVARLLSDAAFANFMFTSARMPAFGRIPA